MKDLGDLKDEHDFCDESEQNFMLMEWVAGSPDRATQECSWPQDEKGCVTLWAIGMILSLDHEENEYFSAQPLIRMKALHGDKAIHPKIPIEVHLKWRVNITCINQNQGTRCEFWITWFDWYWSKTEDKVGSLSHSIWSVRHKGESCSRIRN